MKPISKTVNPALSARICIVKIGEMTISIHWTLLVLLPPFIVIGARAYSHWYFSLLRIMGAVAILLLHEFGHVLAAKRKKIGTREVIISPLGGITVFDSSLKFKDVPLIIGGGLAVNVFLLIPFAILAHTGTQFTGDVAQLIRGLRAVNICLLLLNILPILPLDGSKILECTLERRFGLTKTRIVLATLGILTAGVILYIAIYIRNWLGVLILATLVIINACLLYESLEWLLAESRWGVHATSRCPRCGRSPVSYLLQRCDYCDFESNPLDGPCFRCRSEFGEITCTYCGQASQSQEWRQCPKNENSCDILPVL